MQMEGYTSGKMKYIRGFEAAKVVLDRSIPLLNFRMTKVQKKVIKRMVRGIRWRNFKEDINPKRITWWWAGVFCAFFHQKYHRMHENYSWIGQCRKCGIQWELSKGE